jgi:2-polyprenyl-3-methyl-5-hydroxy-6-metoxy-1,4-benzoquinol methylase
MYATREVILGRMQAPGELLRRATQRIAKIGAPHPLGALLAPARRRACDEVLTRFWPKVRVIEPELLDGRAHARAELAELADEALAEMRARVDASAAELGGATSLAGSLDEWWRETREPEYLDDPDLDERMRQRILEHLDALNDLLGSYRLFFERLRPRLRDDRPTRLLDLAAGHGGFALAIAQIARDEGLGLEVVASDIKPEYLALGEARARAERLEVRFVRQDALDLSALRPGEYDVITSTQALHHFSPGQISVMFAEAARIAGRAVLFIDGSRSALTAAAVCAIGVLGYRDPAFSHDALVSCRRFFVPEELELLGRLGPQSERTRALGVAPGHCLLEQVAR